MFDEPRLSVQLSTPTDAHFPSPESWSLRAPSAMVKREAWEFLGSSPEVSVRVSTPSPPESFLPSPSGPMGFAAAGCLTPSPELSASCTPIPTRTLRARPDSVCYTEPSLKTKMRRPRSPPKPARRRSIKPTPTPAGAAAAYETEARTPLAFVTSRRHRRRVRIVESSSSECEENDARETEDAAFDHSSASPAKPLAVSGNSLPRSLPFGTRRLARGSRGRFARASDVSRTVTARRRRGRARSRGIGR